MMTRRKSEDEFKEEREEVAYYEKTHPREKSRTERVTSAIGSFRDSAYGYDRVKSGKHKGSVKRSSVGRVQFFDNSGPFLHSDPFGVSHTEPAQSIRGKRSPRHDPTYIPDSMRWMF